MSLLKNKSNYQNINEEHDMGAKYESPKPDGYESTRNNIYLEREQKQQVRTYKEAGASRNLPAQSKQNYGKKDYFR
jgi:threonine dehydratase